MVMIILCSADNRSHQVVIAMAGENSKMEEEEEEEKAPIRCINKCGFFGSAATMNLCSKCYRDLLLHNNAFSPDAHRFAAKHTQGFDDVKPPSAACGGAEEEEEEQRRKSKRCVWCKKRVGLTGFSCRCGDLFCSQHRYSDEHNCPFDYKAAAREAIAKANPLVKPEKVDKI